MDILRQIKGLNFSLHFGLFLPIWTICLASDCFGKRVDNTHVFDQAKSLSERKPIKIVRV